MGRPPAYVFIVRHGSRLDAADKLWHLSSPTPYDPPLTYGGWSQCRAIGQRIADILRESAAPEFASTADGSGTLPTPKKHCYKVVIHSSPFLRCIQTSIAISSGIASDSLPLESPRNFDPLPPLRVQTPGQYGMPNEPLSDAIPRHVTPKLHKSVMRLDAFLGEWLSPGYFELITPPPSSVMMIAGAKAELLRREDYSGFAHAASHQAAHNHSHSTSQLWGASRSNTWSSRPSEGEELPKSGSQHIPPVGPFNSSDDERPVNSNGGSSMHPPSVAGYVAPVPHFPISSRAPAPSEYVAHARDACVDLDYQWDSMRAPYDWGDGGEFGEEWTSMHHRFRKGLQKLVDWYSTTDAPAEMVTKTVQFKPAHSKTNSDGSIVTDSECAIDDDDDMDSDGADEACIYESVVVLVTHGAGCNALIGAITQQPVLVDVGLASLSVAARRPGKESLHSLSAEDAQESKWTGAIHSGHPGGIVPLNKYYEMKLLASADHLRSAPTTPTTPRGGSMASVYGGPRGRHSNSLGGAPANFNVFGPGITGQRSSSAGSFHRTSNLTTRRMSGASSRPVITKTVNGGMTSPTSANDRSSRGVTVGSGAMSFSPLSLSTNGLGHSNTSVGLWSPVSSKGLEGLEEDTFALNDGDGDEADDSDMEILLSFGPESPRPSPSENKKAPSIREKSTSGLFYRSSLSITQSVDGDRDDEDKNGDRDDKKDAHSDYTAMASALPPLDNKDTAPSASKRDISAATSTASAAKTSSPGSPSLWVHPRLISHSSDEPTHEMASLKRRWTVTEPPV